MTRIGGMDELGGTRISSRDYFKEVCTVPVSTSTGIKPTPPLYLYMKHANWPFNPAAVLLCGEALPLTRVRSPSVGALSSILQGYGYVLISFHE